MGIQIFGTKKCNNTKKAQRFFKERGVDFHFRDINEKPMSSGELQNVIRTIAPENLVDTESQIYKKRGYQYMDYDPMDELIEYPLLLKTPVVRCGKDSAVGYDQDAWNSFVKNEKQ